VATGAPPADAPGPFAAVATAVPPVGPGTPSPAPPSPGPASIQEAASTPVALAAAAEAPSEAGAKRHDGFFLRFGFGPGYAAAKEESSRGKISGASVTGFLAIGWAVIDDLALHLSSESDFLLANDVKLPSGRSSKDKSNALRNLGLGASYYVMPINLYFSASLNAAKGYRQPEGVSEAQASQWGLGLSLTAGQEFWLSDNWGLGVFARFHVSSFDGQTGKDSYTTNVLALGASATFN
jgi:hypothetical protein